MRGCTYGYIYVSIYLAWNSDIVISLTDGTSEAAVSPWVATGLPDMLLAAKVKAGLDGVAKLDVAWPSSCSMTRTCSIVGLSAGFSCTQRSPRWMHLSTSLSLIVLPSDGSVASRGVPLDHSSHTCVHACRSRLLCVAHTFTCGFTALS